MLLRFKGLKVVNKRKDISQVKKLAFFGNL